MFDNEEIQQRNCSTAEIQQSKGERECWGQKMFHTRGKEYFTERLIT